MQSMEVIKTFISGLGDSNLAIEFKDDTWMRISREKNGRFLWYNSNSPHQTLYFQTHEQCFRILELSISPKNITEVVLNDSQTGNIIVYKKETKELEAAKIMLTIKN